MSRLRVLFALLAMVLAATPAARAGEILDRIVATVNGHIILQSDWEEALHYEAFVNGSSAEQLPASERKAALDRLIDQELLEEQMRASDFRHATDEEIQRRIAEIREHHAEAATDAGWQTVLSRYGFSEKDLKHHVSRELDLMRLVDARLGPNVSVDARSIESYYNQELLPQLRQSGAKEVPLAEVTPKIKEILTQQKLNELLVAWLQNLRSGSEIQTEVDPRGNLR